MTFNATNPGDREARLVRVLAEYLHAAEAGRPLDQQQLLDEHPELAKELRSFFANRAASERVAELLKGFAADATVGFAAAGETDDASRVRLAGEPIVARPSSLTDRARKWVKRKPAMAGLLAVSFLAGLLFVAFVAGLFDRSRLQTQFTEATRQKAAADRERQNVEREHAAAMRQRELAERRKQSFLYAAHVNLIQQAWEVGEMGRMRRLLDEQRPAEDQSDLRGFEWYYLWQRAHTELQILKGHTGVLRSVAFANDGTWLVSGDGSNDNRKPGEVLRWDIATGKPRSLFTQQTATPVGAFMGISTLAVSPDGQLVAVSDNERVRILDSTTGDERHALPAQRDFVKALAFSPDSQLLASGTLDGKVKFWNSTSGEELGTIDALQAGITSLAFSPDGERLAVAGGGTREPTFVQETSGKIAVWNVRTRQSVWRLEKAGPMTSCVAFSPDGKRLATADLHFVNLLDAANGKTINSEHGQTDSQSRVCCVAFSRDGIQLASCGDASIVRLWDGATGKSMGSLNGHETSRVTCLSFAADGTLASGGDDTTVRLWKPSVSADRSRLGPLTWAVQDTVFSRNSQTLAVADYTSVTLYAADTGQPRQTIPVDHWCFGMDLSPDGELLATGGNRGTEGQEPGIVKVWDTTTGNELASLDPHVKSVKRVQFSTDGRHLLAAGWGRSAEESRVTLWNLADFTELGTWENCPAAALAHDSRTLALMRTDGIELWDIAAGRRQNQLVGSDTMQQEFATAGRWLEFSPDDQSLVSVGDERTAIVWDIATLSRRTTLSGHASVERTLYSPDGQTLATMSRTEIRLWDCERYQERYTLPVGNCQFLFTPDSATLITSLGGPKLWHVATGQLLFKLSGYGLPVNCLAISPDGTQLAEAGGWRDENEGVYIWRISNAPR